MPLTQKLTLLFQGVAPLCPDNQETVTTLSACKQAPGQLQQDKTTAPLGLLFNKKIFQACEGSEQ